MVSTPFLKLPTPRLANNSWKHICTSCSPLPQYALDQLRTSHLDTQEVAEADLGDVVTDVLVVLEVSTRNVGVTRKFSGVGLYEVRRW
jgi:hypothetical protein